MTQKLYRAIVVDPATRTIEEVQSTGSHSETLELVGAKGLDHFRLADHDGSWDYGWVDEWGLTVERPVPAFLFSIRPDPIVGRCVIFGVQKEGGANCDAKFPLAVLRQEITWLGLIVPKVDWVAMEKGARAVVSFKRVS